MINTIIFSKNRPAQLDLLLNSIKQYNIFNIKIIYTYTNDLFKNGYNLCQSYHNVLFEQEYNIKLQVLSHISKYTMFLTDDSFFYKPLNIELLNTALNDMNNGLPQFSLRLGLNTYMNYKTESILPKFKSSYIDKNYIVWNSKEYDYNEYYGYKMSVDGHIYDGDNLLKILTQINFGNPNIIECEMNKYENMIGDEIGSFKESVLLVNPVNRVQEICQNWNGELYPISTEDLNTNFLKYKRIQIPIIETNTVHKECLLQMI